MQNKNTLTIKHASGGETTYQLIEGAKDMPIAYHYSTDSEVINALERARKNRTRVRIYLGNTATGEAWNEEHDIFGYIGLSKGSQAYYPILVYNTNSFGGGSLLDHCIIKIKESNGGKILYQNKNFIQPLIEVRESTTEGYTHSVYINNQIYSNHKTEKQAKTLQKRLS